MSKRVAIISTSVSASPRAYVDWTANGEGLCDLIVAGDHNSHPNTAKFVQNLGGVYLRPEEQDHLPWSQVIGWRTIQRRNAALFYALKAGYDYVLTVDDDNFPVPHVSSFVDGHIMELEGHSKVATVVGSPSNYLNPGLLCTPQFHARGVPYGVITQPVIRRPDTKRVGKWGTVTVTDVPRVVVSQAQVIGDPDCDAVERMCFKPRVQAVMADAVVAPGTYAPFNSQATMWTGDWAGVAAVLPGVGRYDDIFASFIFARLAREYNTAVHFGTPVVRQDRNYHDGVSDLRQEVWGMRHTFTFCGMLDAAHISADMPLPDAYDELIIATSDVLPEQTVKFAHAWVKTWREIVR